MKKIVFLLIVVGLVLTGCSSSKKVDELKIIAPSGAPALSLIELYQDINKEGEVKIVEGSDLLSSELIKKDSQYDVIIAPINLGCQLISKKQTDYKLAGVITWGNLYIVENEKIKDNQLSAFGEQAVPGKIFNLIKDTYSAIKDSKVTYYNAISDVQAQLLAGKCQYALMAEPAATATIAKGKENNVNLKIIASLQELYQEKMNSAQSGYPQAAVFVKNKEDTKDFLTKISSPIQTDNIEKLVEDIGPQVLGVPNGKIAAKTWKNQNIHYQDASLVKEDIQSLLKEFKIEYDDSLLL